jgi:hypothetical protein
MIGQQVRARPLRPGRLMRAEERVSPLVPPPLRPRDRERLAALRVYLLDPQIADDKPLRHEVPGFTDVTDTSSTEG